MAAGSAFNNILPKIKLTPSLWIVTIIATLMSFIPFIFGGFINTFIWFLDMVGMILGPEIAILLVDFFFVRSKNYDTNQFSKIDGKYWYQAGFNVRSYITWVISIAVYFGLQQVTLVTDTVGSTWLAMLFAAGLYAVLSLKKAM